MEVAVCVNSHCLVISQGEGNIEVITGLEGLHFLAATHHRHAGVMDHAHQIAAVTADVNFALTNNSPLIVFRAHLEECLGMLADRANLGSLGSNDQVAAVTALPHSNAALLKYLHSLHVV